jgi:indole-3-glycerol phosphate synthase
LGVLGRILAETRERVHQLREREQDFHDRAVAAPAHPPFAAALDGEAIAVIAELKRRSPSKGAIHAALAPTSQARAYERGGAAAISVLTEPAHFGGDLSDLGEARRGSGLPLLRKDFIVHPVQIAEARAAGASAVLLIARALAPEQLPDLLAAVQAYALESLVEVRSEDELDRALALPVSVIGVNSRDLETLEVDRAVSARLLPLIPADRIAVAESGVSSAADAAELAHMGADAVLVGSVLSASADPAALIRQLAAVPRMGRARRD